ncbi:MAG: hypothetical protein ABFS17_12625 [Chloroflexota bacterium]
MINKIINSKYTIQISQLLLLSALVLSFGYLFFWMSDYSSSSLNLPLGFFIRANKTLLVLIVILIILSYPALILSKIYISIPIYVLSFLLICLFSIFTLYSRSIIDQVEYNEHKYYFVHQPSIGDPWTIYSLLRCDSIGQNCQTLYHDTSNSITPIEFQFSDEKDKLNIFIDSNIAYLDGDSFVRLNTIDCGDKSDYWFCAKLDPQKDKLLLSRCEPPYKNADCVLWSLQLSQNDLNIESGYFTNG